MCRVAAGTRRRADAVVVEADGNLECPRYFAPGYEEVEITYTYWRRGSMQGAQVSLEIKDKDDNSLYRSTALTLRDRPDSENPGRYTWNGRNDAGEIIAKPQNGPYKVILKIGDAVTRERTINVQVHALYVWVRRLAGVRNGLLMNDADGGVDVITSVTIRSQSGAQRPLKTRIEVKYSFEADGNNIQASQSYQYSGSNRLGKRGNAAAVFWEEADHSEAESDDEWKQTCRAMTVGGEGPRRAKAYIKFKPSGYGGDKFRIKAEVKAEHSGRVDGRGNRQKVERQSPWLTVWRKVSMRGYEMPSYRHITNHGRPGSMDDYYSTNDTYVKYELRGSITALTNARYIGLWDHSSRSYRDWNTWKSKRRTSDPATNETPTDDDIIASADGSSASASDRQDARDRIQRCADNWKTRIYDAYGDALSNWLSDHSIPAGSLIGLGYEHPKISHNAPASDSVTNEWKSPELDWLTVDVESTDVHPDLVWIRSMGLSRNRRAFIFYDSDATELEKTVAHEVGHETKNHFERHQFRPASASGRSYDSDHTNSAGLMDPSGSLDNFTAGEKRVLRGKDNP